MCRDTPVPLVCTSAYSQMCIYTEAHSDFDFCYLGRILSHVVLAFGQPVLCLFWIHLVDVWALQRQGYGILFFFFFVVYSVCFAPLSYSYSCAQWKGATPKHRTHTHADMDVYGIPFWVLQCHFLRKSSKPIWAPANLSGLQQICTLHTC